MPQADLRRVHATRLGRVPVPSVRVVGASQRACAADLVRCDAQTGWRHSATMVVMGVLAVTYVLNLLTRGLVAGLFVMSNEAVAAGQFWRLITSSFAGVGLFATLLNLLVLWLVGRPIESELGPGVSRRSTRPPGWAARRSASCWARPGWSPPAGRLLDHRPAGRERDRQAQDARGHPRRHQPAGAADPLQRPDRVLQLRLAGNDRRSAGRCAVRRDPRLRSAAEPDGHPGVRPAGRRPALPDRGSRERSPSADSAHHRVCAVGSGLGGQRLLAVGRVSAGTAGSAYITTARQKLASNRTTASARPATSTRSGSRRSISHRGRTRPRDRAASTRGRRYGSRC